MGGRPHFGPDRDSVYVHFSDGLNRVRLDGSGQTKVLSVTGPGWYFSDAPGTPDDLRLSPDGKWALAIHSQQLHLIAMPAAGAETVDLETPSPGHRKLTEIGADFAEWSADGSTIYWSIGSTISAPLPGLTTATQSWDRVVELPRDVPKGAVLLRGATVLTIRGAGTIENADLLIVDDRIAGVGPRAALAAPPEPDRSAMSPGGSSSPA